MYVFVFNQFNDKEYLQEKCKEYNIKVESNLNLENQLNKERIELQLEIFKTNVKLFYNNEKEKQQCELLKKQLLLTQRYKEIPPSLIKTKIEKNKNQFKTVQIEIPYYDRFLLKLIK